MSTIVQTLNLTELRVGDVIVDPQGGRNTVTEPVEGPFIDEDGDTAFKVYTDTYPRGGIMDGRTIAPLHGPETILFKVERNA